MPSTQTAPVTTDEQTEKKAQIRDPRLKVLAASAREFRTLKNSVAGVTVHRAELALSEAGKTAEQVIKSFGSVADAKAFASGDKTVKATPLVKEIGERVSDPFARNRGLVAISLALKEYKPEKAKKAAA